MERARKTGTLEVDLCFYLPRTQVLLTLGDEGELGGEACKFKPPLTLPLSQQWELHRNQAIDHFQCLPFQGKHLSLCFLRYQDRDLRKNPLGGKGQPVSHALTSHEMATIFSPCKLDGGGEICIVHLSSPLLYGEAKCLLDAFSSY